MALTADTTAPTWLARALALAATALAAWLLVRLVLSIIEPSRAFQPVDIAAPASAATVSAPKAYDFSTNPFAAGDADAADDRPAAVEEDAPETTLNLVVTGLRAGPTGSAFIQTPSGDADNFYVGDAVMNGVVLRDVRADHALLDVNGQLQRLTLEDAKKARAASANTRTRAPAATAQTTLLRRPDIQTLMRQVDLRPALGGDGQRLGIKVVPRASGLDLGDYGLRSSDVVTRVGSVDLTSGLPDVAALQREASGGRPVAITVLRDGAPMTLTIGGPA